MAKATAQNLNDQTIMSTEEKLQALKNEIIVTIKEAFDDCQLINLLEKNSSVDGVVKTQFLIDINKIKSKQEPNIVLEFKDDLEVTSNTRSCDCLCYTSVGWKKCCCI